MVDTTFDEIRRCPRCEELGIHSGTQSGPNRTTIYLFTCDNDQCRWFNSAPWLRQRYPDGTWVPAQRHQKFFPLIPDRTQEVRDAVDRDIQRSLSREP